MRGDERRETNMKDCYYLHTNGDLIYKREFDGSTVAGIRESDFAVGLWFFDPQDRESAWAILVEGLAAGASKDRIADLMGTWQCDNEDAVHYAKRIGCALSQDGDQYCATCADFLNLQESPAGFGHTALEAMADLCKTLGYSPSKMWGASFADLCKDHEPTEGSAG